MPTTGAPHLWHRGLLMRIVVAEDSRDIREYLHEVLCQLGHEVVSAGCGEELVETALAVEPDLVLTDLCMGGAMDGIDAVVILKGYRDVAAVLLTAKHDVETLRRAEEARILLCLSKPVRPVDLEIALGLARARIQHAQERPMEERPPLTSMPTLRCVDVLRRTAARSWSSRITRTRRTR